MGGKYYIFEDDELKTEDDEVGNTKIDANGNLLGGTCVMSISLQLLTMFYQGEFSRLKRSVVHGEPTLINDTCSPLKQRVLRDFVIRSTTFAGILLLSSLVFLKLKRTISYLWGGYLPISNLEA